MSMNWVTNSGYLTNNKLNLDFQKVAQPLFKFRQFVTIKESFGKQQGQSVNWLKVANLSTRGGSLVETNTMLVSDQSLTWGTLTVNEYGNSIPFTFKLESLSEFDIKQIIRSGLLDDQVKVIDGIVEREFNKCPLRYVGTSTTTGTLTTDSSATVSNTSVLNSYHVRKMRLALEKLNAPTYDGNDYAGIFSLEAMESLEGAMESTQQYTEAGYKQILNGEVGRVHGVRFVKDGYATRYVTSASARTDTAITWAQLQSGVGYICGKNTVREAVVVPEEIRMKVVTDYGRSKGLAWYFLGGWAIEWSEAANCRIVKWDTNG
jgi:N4-gp56 family major capsid protein